MLARDELARWAARFGVAPAQIVRDHLVSHLLLGIAESSISKRVIFFGGTALARTHLTDLRLSEDIDLWADDPSDVLEAIEQELPRQVRREYPRLYVETAGPSTRILTAPDGTRTRLQVVSYSAEYGKCIEPEQGTIALRYSDLPDSVGLRVPSLPAFAAMKHLAWTDRSAPRDLVDLAGLANLDALDRNADEIITCLRGFGVRRHDIEAVPVRARTAWHADLAHQMAEVPDLDEALAAVQLGWETFLS